MKLNILTEKNAFVAHLNSLKFFENAFLLLFVQFFQGPFFADWVFKTVRVGSMGKKLLLKVERQFFPSIKKWRK